MLAMFLLQELEKELETTPQTSNHTIIYFFCSFSDARLNTATAILSSLIYQLIQRHRTMGRHATSSFSSQSRANETLRSATALWKVLNRMLSDPGIGKIFCVLDGLDECDLESQDFLASCFADLATGTPGTKAYGLNIIILSQELSRPVFQGTSHLRLDANHNHAFKRDVNLFLTERLQGLSIPGSDAHFHKRLFDCLSDGAQDTFLWVGYVTKELYRSKSKSHAEEMLQNLPRDLNGIYGHMLSRGIRSHNAKLERICFILHAVALACRPLTINELATLHSLEFGGRNNSNQVIDGLISLCGEFLRVHPRPEGHGLSAILGKDMPKSNSQYDHVTLFHKSAKKYLLRPDVDSDPLLEKLRIQDKRIGHLRLARICLGTVRNSRLRGIIAPHGRLHGDPCPLFQYAAHHWAVHARKSHQQGCELILVNDTNSMFSEYSFPRENWMRWYKSCSHGQDRPNCRVEDIHHYILPKPTMDQLPLACALGMEAWVEALLAEPKTLSHRTDWAQLLYSAIINDHRAVVSILHSKGADINSDALPDHGQYQIVASTPLMIACSLKMTTMVDHLIGLGADVNLITKCGLSALDLVRQRKRLRKSLLPILLRGCLIDQDAEIDKLVNFSSDSLSISAAVVGLRLTATSVHKVLYDMTLSVINAPKSVNEASTTVQETSEAILDIYNLINKETSMKNEDKGLIRLDHLTKVIQLLILTLSELESLTVADTKDGLMDRPRWMREEGQVQELLATLRVSNSCLSMLFAIANE